MTDTLLLQKNLVRAVFLFLLTVLFIFFHTVYVSAADDVEDKLEELEELQKKEEKYRNLIDIKDREATVIRSQVSSLDSQSKKIEGEIDEAKTEVEKISKDITQTEKKIIEKESAITSQKNILATILRSKYDQTLEKQSIADLFGSESESIFSASDRLAYTSLGLGEIIKLVTSQRDTLTKDKEDLTQSKIKVDVAKNELQKKNIQLETTRDQKALLALQTESEKSKFEDRLDKVLREQLEIQQEIDSLGTVTIGSFNLSDIPSKKDADLSRPVKAPYIVTQGYGRTSFSHHYNGGNHNGVDYVAKGSKDIRSAGDGKVKATGNMGRYGYGKWVAIDHENGLVSLYGHMSSVNVDKGDKLDGGDKIGVQGTTGFSTGNHLHFTLFASSTFKVVSSSSVSGIYIPTGGTVNPALFF